MSKQCKVVVLGDSGVGKTTIIHHYINNEFRADFKATIGADFTSKIITENRTSVDLQIWDTAGEERFHSVGAAFYRGADACILVYDITQQESFTKLQNWRDDLYVKSGISPDEDFIFIAFGNKADLAEQRQVAEETAKSWGELNHISVFEVSAKSGQNIENGFQELVRLFMKSCSAKRESSSETITIKIQNRDANNKCC